jgi:hypothetical protein
MKGGFGKPNPLSYIHIMIIKISIVIKSQLNDAMIEVRHPKFMDEAQERLRFVMYLIHMFPNTNEEIDVDAVYKEFTLRSKN